jgi:exosortase
MLPLPYRLEVSLAHPLQQLATTCSVFVLQTIGLAAVAEGNVIIMESARIGVVEACNGLGMLVTFFAVSAALALMLTSWLEKAVVVASAIPVALVANVARIALAGLLAEWIGPEAADSFHNSYQAAFFSMLVGLGTLGLELWLLSRMFPEAPPDATAAYFKHRSAASVASKTRVAPS